MKRGFMRKHNQQDVPDDNPRHPLDSQPQKNQLIPEKGEEYLREVANIEDMPSPAEDKEAENVLKEEEQRESFRE
jgi:hypothetical protein